MGSFSEAMEFDPGTSTMISESEVKSEPMQPTVVNGDSEFEFDPATARMVPKESVSTFPVKQEKIEQEEDLVFNPTSCRMEPRVKTEIKREPARQERPNHTTTGGSRPSYYDKKTGKLSEHKGKPKTERRPVAVDMNKRGTGGFF